MSKNDVWSELEERLKLKAFLHGRTAKGKEPVCSMYPDNVGYAVWLEDVKEAIQQLKQNYVLIERGELKDFLRACLEASLEVGDEITLKLMELLKEC